MLIKIGFKECSDYIKLKADKDIKFKYLNPSVVIIEYLVNIDLKIKSLNNDEIILGYDLNKIAEMMAKGQIQDIFNKLDANIIKINMDRREIYVNLANVPGLNQFLKDFIISSLGFDKDGINIELSIR